MWSYRQKERSAFDTVLIKTLKCHDSKVLIAYFSASIPISLSEDVIVMVNIMILRLKQ